MNGLLDLAPPAIVKRVAGELGHVDRAITATATGSSSEIRSFHPGNVDGYECHDAATGSTSSHCTDRQSARAKGRCRSSGSARNFDDHRSPHTCCILGRDSSRRISRCSSTARVPQVETPSASAKYTAGVIAGARSAHIGD